MGSRGSKLHVNMPDMGFMEIKDTQTGSYQHTRYLRSCHSLWRASPCRQYILKWTLSSCPAGLLPRKYHAHQLDSHGPYRHLDDPAHTGLYTAVSPRLKPSPGVSMPILSLQMTFLGWSHLIMYLLLLMDETGKGSRLRFTS